MEDNTPFSQSALSEIFQVSPAHPDRVKSRESSTVEFKKSFGLNSLAKYSKTCAAFANNRGGYIIFGIDNNPHKLIGLEGNSLVKFRELDPEKLSNFFNEHFSPEIRWTVNEHELGDKIYGILYVYESANKPVVCKKDDSNDIKEGDIYYRYRGRSERAKYPEIIAILDNRREKEQELWMKHIQRIAKIGVRESGIFDLHSGKITGPGGTYVIDESHLSQLAFIKEGEFSEIKGMPALKLIGNVEPISYIHFASSKNNIVKTKGIRTADIVFAVLNAETIQNPESFITQICFETSAYLPVYYFIKLTRKSINEIIELLESTLARGMAKQRLIERIKQHKKQFSPISQADTPASRSRRKEKESILSENASFDVQGKKLESLLHAVRGLSQDEMRSHKNFLSEQLTLCFNKHYGSAESMQADLIRKTICWYDEALYMPDEFFVE